MYIYPDGVDEFLNSDAHTGKLRTFRVPIPQRVLKKLKTGEPMQVEFLGGESTFGPEKILEIQDFAIIKDGVAPTKSEKRGL